MIELTHCLRENCAPAYCEAVRAVRCATCGATGPHVKPENAAAAWNTWTQFWNARRFTGANERAFYDGDAMLPFLTVD